MKNVTPRTTPTTPLSADDAHYCNAILNPEQASPEIGAEVSTLAVWRTTGRYALPFVKVGRRIFYRRSDIIPWHQARTQTQTVSGGAS